MKRNESSVLQKNAGFLSSAKIRGGFIAPQKSRKEVSARDWTGTPCPYALRSYEYLRVLDA